MDSNDGGPEGASGSGGLGLGGGWEYTFEGINIRAMY